MFAMKLTPIGEPFQARALAPPANRKSFEGLRLAIGKEYHRTHLFIRQRTRTDFSSPTGAHDGWR